MFSLLASPCLQDPCTILTSTVSLTSASKCFMVQSTSKQKLKIHACLIRGSPRISWRLTVWLLSFFEHPRVLSILNGESIVLGRLICWSWPLTIETFGLSDSSWLSALKCLTASGWESGVGWKTSSNGMVSLLSKDWLKLLMSDCSTFLASAEGGETGLVSEVRNAALLARISSASGVFVLCRFAGRRSVVARDELFDVNDIARNVSLELKAKFLYSDAAETRIFLIIFSHGNTTLRAIAMSQDYLATEHTDMIVSAQYQEWRLLPSFCETREGGPPVARNAPRATRLN